MATKTLMALLMSIVCYSVSHAAIYQSVDEHGHTTFSDQKQPGAAKVELTQPLSIYAAPPTVDIYRSEHPAAKVAIYDDYTQLIIQQPAHDQTIRNNHGTVTVTVTLKPRLYPAHKLVLFVDDKQIEQTPKQDNGHYTFLLENMLRGTHHIRAAIVSYNDTPIYQSSVITFHMKRPFKFKDKQWQAPKL